MWSRLNVIPVTESYVNHAAELVLEYPLSGADAIHLATATSLEPDSLVTFVSWDRRQAAAAADLGLVVVPAADVVPD